MGSDCAYFSGPELSEEDKEDTIDFNLHSKITKKSKQRSNSDGEFADFDNQVIDDNDMILDDDNFDVTYEDEEADAYVSSRYDFMYSEDDTEQEDIRQSIHLREKMFYGDDKEEEKDFVT